jgi:hypothetical protein
MFSYQLYNVVHIVGLIFLMAGLGGMSSVEVPSHRRAWIRRSLAAFHGLGVFLILLGGFGMLARLGIVQGIAWPGWLWAKVIIWGVLGVSAFIPYRYPRAALPLLFLLPLLGGLAAYMAIYKPL